jgi:hypothetical protein
MPKRNRKKEHYGSLLTINNEQLEINSTDTLGVYPKIIEKMVEQLDICIAIHKRVLVVRFDLHLREYSDDNHIISTFMTRQKQRIKRTYKTKDIGHVWKREKEKAKHQHYHVALFIDGDVIQNPSRLFRQIKYKWYKYGSVWFPKKKLETDRGCFYYIDKHNYKDERAEVIKRLSYLAKTRGTGYKGKQAKNYSVSRLSR